MNCTRGQFSWPSYPASSARIWGSFSTTNASSQGIKRRSCCRHSDASNYMPNPLIFTFFKRFKPAKNANYPTWVTPVACKCRASRCRSYSSYPLDVATWST